MSGFMNIRVADIQACYELWKGRGAEFITEPSEKYGERLCDMRDPDGYRSRTEQTGLPVRLALRWQARPADIKETSIEVLSSMSIQTSFQADIRPLFTERDIDAMTKAFNLANYDDVKAHAAAIYDRIRGIGGAVMPPPPPRGGGPWPQSRIELFAKWMADGCRP